jgi:transcription factor C subunit 3
MVHRLTDCWQISQPPHLRHLALVRDSDVHKTIIHYVHYSARNFSTKVIEGTAFWEAVEFPDRKHKSLKTELPRVDAPAELDQYGLPHNNIPVGMMKNGNISLFEGLASCKPADYSLTRKDPMGVIQADGSYRKYPSFFIFSLRFLTENPCRNPTRQLSPSTGPTTIRIQDE